MNLEEAYKIGTVVLTSFGGASIILIALSSWLGKLWASRILQDEKNKFTIEVEELRAKLKLSEQGYSTVLSLYEHIQNTKYSRIDADRAEAIKIINNNLFQLEYYGIQLNEKIGDLDNSNPNIKQETIEVSNFHTDIFNKASETAINNATLYAIYFEEDLFFKIYTTMMALIQETQKFMVLHWDKFNKDDFSNIPTFKKDYQVIINEIYIPQKQDLVKKLREVLGSNL